MNNNRNNNRRRGRGNRQQGGGNQNRIDSRARGNAPQLLDKYKKLAQDAAHNGDRVQAEYYLQFADHYFRVIADNKARQDEGRGAGRQGDRDWQSDEDGDEDDFDAARQQPPRQNDRGDRGDRGDRQRQRSRRDDRDDRDDYRSRDDAGPSDEAASDGDTATDFEPTDNPFIRGNRDRNRGRDDDREPRRGRGSRSGGQNTPMADDAGEIDATALPPSFSSAIDAPEADVEEKPKRKLPPRRRRPTDDAGDDGETLKAVG